MSAGDRDHADGTPRRFADCAKLNPANDDYHPNCCRFPKSCSPYPHPETPVTDDDLEPRRGPLARQVSVSAGDRDTLAGIIEQHATLLGNHPNRHCKCGEPIDSAYGLTVHNHRAHLADVLLASDWLREQRVEAWKAGHGWCDDGDLGCDHEPFTPNPYLED